MAFLVQLPIIFSAMFLALFSVCSLKLCMPCTQKLTGGTLLSRNKDYIVFYRGNDFLPPVVTEAFKERLKLTNIRQDEEEQARQTALGLIESKAKAPSVPLVAGTLAETLAATSRWGSQPSSEDVEEMLRDSALTRHSALVKYLQKKLVLVSSKWTRLFSTRNILMLRILLQHFLNHVVFITLDGHRQNGN